MNSRLVFFVLLIQLCSIDLVLSKSIDDERFELFSLSYGNDNDLKVNVLSATIYDEQKIKLGLKNTEVLIKEAEEKINKIDQECDTADQQKNENVQKIIIKDQETSQVKSSIEQVDKNIQLKRAALKKALEEL